MITIKNKGNFKKAEKYFKKSKKVLRMSDAKYLAEKCVERLKEATPKDSGFTASSWKYKLTKRGLSTKMEFYNTNIQNGVPIAIVIDTGHMSKGGTWIQGKNYIDPALKITYDQIIKAIWRELTRL